MPVGRPAKGALLVPLKTVLVLALVVSLGVACAAPESLAPEIATTAIRSPSATPAVRATVQLLETAPAAPTQTSEPVSIPASVTPISPVPAATSTGQALSTESIPVFGYRVVNKYPHDAEAWTQGLVMDDNILYEGTGLKERSSLRQVELETGRLLKLLPLPAQYFGEGLTVYGDRIYQLTWKSGIGFVYDRDSFELLDTFQYAHQGWGLTHDGRQLIMSDGTETLHFLDPETLEETGTVQVMAGDRPVPRLNELEYIHGDLYANVWPTTVIARIDPLTGQVTGWIDLSSLLPVDEAEASVKILNGIAYDAEYDRLFVTGKFWPTLFEIELVPVD